MLTLVGCQTPAPVNPRFGLQTLEMQGTVTWQQGPGSRVGEFVLRFESPGKFELHATADGGEPWCHLLADGDLWDIELPQRNLRRRGTGTPADEEMALWLETRRMVAMAIKKAMFIEDFTEVVRGEYRSRRLYSMELSEFGRVVGQMMATKMKLSCRGCRSSIQMEVARLR